MTGEYPDISISPVPDLQLLYRKHYASMSIQISRGRPFSCEFCNIATLNGHEVRTKTVKQILAELDNLYDLNWRAQFFSGRSI